MGPIAGPLSNDYDFVHRLIRFLLIDLFWSGIIENSSFSDR
jgi:hypothetical protein